MINGDGGEGGVNEGEVLDVAKRERSQKRKKRWVEGERGEGQ